MAHKVNHVVVVRMRCTIDIDTMAQYFITVKDRYDVLVQVVREDAI